MSIRAGTSVNLDRYDDRIDSLVPDRAQNMAQTSKQKLTKKNTDRRSFGSKRRNEEQEKMRRLQQEVAKAKPSKVLIPDDCRRQACLPPEKKTASEVIKQLMKLGVMAQRVAVYRFRYRLSSPWSWAPRWSARSSSQLRTA